MSVDRSTREALADYFGSEDEVSEAYEDCGKHPVVGVIDGAETLGVCRGCLEETRRQWAAEGRMYAALGLLRWPDQPLRSADAPQELSLDRIAWLLAPWWLEARECAFALGA